MRFRPATRADVPYFADIQGLCNTEDTLVLHCMKNIDKYYASYRQSGVRFLTGKFHEKGACVLAAETEPSDYATAGKYRAPEIVGFAYFNRVGTSDKAKEWQTKLNGDWASAFERFCISVNDKYISFFPSLDICSEWHKSPEVSELLSRPPDPEIFKEYWRVELLFTHPDWQRKGIAKRLMKWVFDRAQEEKVPVVVASSPRGGVAYTACGFKAMYKEGFGAYFDELEFGGEPIQLRVWEPQLEKGDGVLGGWYERAKAKHANDL